MSQHLRLSLAGLATVTVIAASCGSSMSTASKSSTTSTTVPSQTTTVSSHTTTARSTSTSAPSDANGTDGTSGGVDGSTTSISDAACKLVTVGDLTTAGVKGTINNGKPQQSGLQDDPTSSVCEFDIQATNSGSNLIVQLAPKGGKHMYSTLEGAGSGTIHPITGLGDESEIIVEKPDAGDPNGSGNLQLLVLKGDVVLDLEAPSAAFVNQDSLTALARAIVTKLG